MTKTSTSAQLRKPKVFSRLWAFIWFLGFGVGIIVYLLWYMAKRDYLIHIAVDEYRAVTTKRS